MKQSLWRVFQSYRYIAVAVLTAILALAASIWLRNLKLIIVAFKSPLFSFSDTLILLFRLLGGIVTDAAPLTTVLIIVMSLLFGVNTAMLIYHFAHRRRLPRAKESATAIGSIVTAVFGVGCVSCGTFVLGALLSSMGASGLLLLLPFGGHEFLMISVALLTASIYWMAKSIHINNVCVPAELKKQLD